VTGGLLREYGSGGHSYYASLGGGAYTAPAGDPGTLSSATAGGVTTYTYSAPDGRAWTFDNSGYQVKALSADGFAAVSYTYSGGKVSKIETPDGGISTLSYSGGLLSTIKTGGRTVTLTMSSGDLATITNPDGGIRTLTYDGSTHRMTRWDLAG